MYLKSLYFSNPSSFRSFRFQIYHLLSLSPIKWENIILRSRAFLCSMLKVEKIVFISSSLRKQPQYFKLENSFNQKYKHLLCWAKRMARWSHCSYPMWTAGAVGLCDLRQVLAVLNFLIYKMEIVIMAHDLLSVILKFIKLQKTKTFFFFCFGFLSLWFTLLVVKSSPN